MPTPTSATTNKTGDGSLSYSTPVTPTNATGRVTSLDRGFPLVRTPQEEVRAQHSIELVKTASQRAVVGDWVTLEFPPGQDTPLITAILPRGHTLVRRSLVESRHEGAGKHDEQILAANIDIVFVVCALSNRPLDPTYLERQLVMAHQSGAQVAILLTKADLARHRESDLATARALAFDSPVIVESAVTGEGLPSVLALLAGGKTGVLLGRSGVGKSTLINKLLGTALLDTATVRAKDQAGRHTTVARKMVFIQDAEAVRFAGENEAGQKGTVHLSAGQKGARQDKKGTVHSVLLPRNYEPSPFCPVLPLSPSPYAMQTNEPSPFVLPPPGTVDTLFHAAALIDTPGLRSIGLYDAHEGLAATFPDITAYAAHCRYRDCTHTSEPACAVQTAVAQGLIQARRLTAYNDLAREVAD